MILALLFAGAPALFADEWADNYNQGVQAVESGQWQVAIDFLDKAVAANPRPDAQATTSNLQMVRYLPYFYRGQAFFFNGKYEQARADLETSEQYRVVEKTGRLPYLQRMLQLARELAQARRDGLKSQATGPADTGPKQVAPAPETTEDSSGKNKLARLFEAALDNYLLGRYEEALRGFEQIAAVDANFSSAGSWEQKTREDLLRLRVNVPPAAKATRDSVFVERRIVETTAPVFAMTRPAAPRTEVHSARLALAGKIGDDRGIGRVEFSVNGSLLRDAQGNILTVSPTAGSDAKDFAFSTEIDLRMGENQIVATAYDIDAPPKRATQRFTVIRKPPFYRTSAFAISVAALALLFLASALITRRVKYRIAIVNKYNPYIAGSPVRTREMFFGREQLIRQILNTLHNNSLMIYGPRRIGKTSLQHQLKLRLEADRDPDYLFVPVFIDLQGTAEAQFFAAVMHEVLETCKQHIDAPETIRFSGNKPYPARDFSHDLQQLLNALNARYTKQVKLVLQLDEVDELNKYSEQVNQKLRSVFMKTFAENLVAVMSGSYIKKNWQSEGSPWYNFFEEIPVPPLDCSDAERLITEPVAGIFSYEDAAVQKILDMSQCQPYMTQRICIQVINRLIAEKRRKAVLADVEAVEV